MHVLCTGDWLLTLDADELLGPEATRLLPALMADRRYAAYSFERLTLYPDEEHYLIHESGNGMGRPLPASERDTPVRLYRRRGAYWQADDVGGQRVSLRVSRRGAHTSSCAAVPVRHLGLPLFDFRLLHRLPPRGAGESQSSPAALTGQEAGSWAAATVDLSSFRHGLTRPPATPIEGRHWLRDRERRIDELVEYTALTRSEIVECNRSDPQEHTWADARARLPTPLLAELLLDERAKAETESALREMERDGIEGTQRVLVAGDGAEDLSLEMLWRGVPQVACLPLGGEGSAGEQFVLWRRERFGLDGRLEIARAPAQPHAGWTVGAATPDRPNYDAAVLLPGGQGLIGGDPASVVRSLCAAGVRRIVCVPGRDTEPEQFFDQAVEKVGGRRTGRYIWELRHRRVDHRRRPTKGARTILTALIYPEWLHALSDLDYCLELLPTVSTQHWSRTLPPPRSNVHLLPLETWRYPEKHRGATLGIMPFRFTDWIFALCHGEDDLFLLSQTTLPIVFAPGKRPADVQTLETVLEHAGRIVAAVFPSPQLREAWGWTQRHAEVIPPAALSVVEGSYKGELKQAFMVCQHLGAGNVLNRVDAKMPCPPRPGQVKAPPVVLPPDQILRKIVREHPMFVCDTAALPAKMCGPALLDDYFRSRRVYVHVTGEQGLHNLLRAVTSGMPAVVWEGGGLEGGGLERIYPGLFRDGETCYLSEDADYLYRRLGDLLSDLGLSRRMGEAAAAIASSHYSRAAWLESWGRVLPS
jgi:hypothetical protein